MDKKVFHIHVGKCAGSSINKALNKLNIKFTELHCGDAPEELRGILSKDCGNNLYLITARNPIDRFISAFNWDKYEKIINKKSENPFWENIYSTFTSVEDLVQSLYSTNSERKKLAEATLYNSKLHVQFGLSWYISKNVLNDLPMDRTVLINTESLLSDFNLFLQFIENSNYPLNSLAVDKDSSGFLDLIEINNPKYLSSDSKAILEKVLKEDFETLEILKRNSALASIAN